MWRTGDGALLLLLLDGEESAAYGVNGSLAMNSHQLENAAGCETLFRLVFLMDGVDIERNFISWWNSRKTVELAT